MLLKKVKMNRSKFLPLRPSKPVFRNPGARRRWARHPLGVPVTDRASFPFWLKCKERPMSNITVASVLLFWRQAGPERWFKRDESFDLIIRSRFMAIHEAAARGEFAAFEESPEGSLALVILLDQFPRNMFRDSAHAFATDPLARAVASRALARQSDRAIDQTLRPVLYLPFMHSELSADQDRSMMLYEAFGDMELLRYAVIHRDIILRFGRFPHRNQAMGRDTTPAEQEFLDGGGFAG
jgi:uncharacterized protein (DUF924 family)